MIAPKKRCIGRYESAINLLTDVAIEQNALAGLLGIRVEIIHGFMTDLSCRAPIYEFRIKNKVYYKIKSEPFDYDYIIYDMANDTRHVIHGLKKVSELLNVPKRVVLDCINTGRTWHNYTFDIMEAEQ